VQNVRHGPTAERPPIKFMTIREQQQLETARRIPMPILAKALLTQAKQAIAFSEKECLELAAAFNDAAEHARRRRERSQLPYSRITGVLADMDV
jgi:hypothetical protein